MIENLNTWHSRDPQLSVNQFTTSIFSMCYYDSVLVIEKRPLEQPSAKITGTPSW